MLLSRAMDRGLGLASTLILVRLLTPQDFGVVAMAMSFVSLVEIFSLFSFDIALIRTQKAERSHYDTAWTLNTLLGVIIGFALLLLSVPASLFFKEPALVLIIVVLSLGPVLDGLENIGTVQFRKELQFDKEFRFLLIKRLSMVAMTIPLAYVTRSYWALIVGMLFGKGFSLCTSFLVHSYRPRFSLHRASELMDFSKWLLINNVLYFFRDRTSDFVIGRLLGSKTLGLYSVSYEIANLTTTELVAPINRAVFPGYAKHGASAAQLGRNFLDVLSMICLIALPAALGISAIAPLLVEVALGPAWIDAVPLVRLLPVYASLSAMTSNAGYVYLALGGARTLALINMSQVLILLPTLTIATYYLGAEGAAYAMIFSMALVLPINFSILRSLLAINLGDLLRVVWRPILAASLMYVSTTQWIHLSTLETAEQAVPDQALKLAAAIVIGASVYIITVLLSWRVTGRPRGAESFVLNRLRALTRPSGS